MTPFAVGGLTLAASALGLLAVFNALWHHAGSSAALDANENVALLTWILGWCLLVGATAAMVVWLIAATRDALAHRRVSLVNVSLFVAYAAVMIIAVTIAPLWGAGAATA